MKLVTRSQKNQTALMIKHQISQINIYLFKLHKINIKRYSIRSNITNTDTALINTLF